MKSKRYRRLLWLASVPVATITCVEMGEIIHPANPMADSEIEILVNIKVVSEDTRTNKLAFGVLAPKVWDLANNATLTVSSDDYVGAGDTPIPVVDVPLSVIPSSEVTPSDGNGTGGMRWDLAFMKLFGNKGNDAGNVVWTVFESPEPYEFPNGKVANAVVKIRLKTTEENIKVNMGYAYCGKEKGLDDRVDAAKILQIKGGKGPLADYTGGRMLLSVSDLEVTHPAGRVVAGTQTEVGVSMRVSGSTVADSPLAFGMLVPVSWDMGAADVRLTTSGYGGGDISEERMTVVEDDALEPVGGLPWSAAFMTRFDKMENFGDEVRWVVFRSASNLVIDGQSDDFTANVSVKFTTGAENIKTRLGYAATGFEYGFPETYISNAVARTMISAGGAGPDPKIDYTRDPSLGAAILFKTSPSVFGFGDILSVRFDVAGEDYETLADGDVYIYMSAELVDSGEKVVTKTLMQNMNGGTVWQKHFYPPTFFELGDGEVIEHIRIHFTNDAGSVVVDNGGTDFIVREQ